MQWYSSRNASKIFYIFIVFCDLFFLFTTSFFKQVIEKQLQKPMTTLIKGACKSFFSTVYDLNVTIRSHYHFMEDKNVSSHYIE